MNVQSRHFAMRELLVVIRSPLLWVALAGAAFVLGLAGPFGTYEALSLPARLAYWAVVVTTTYLACTLIVHLLSGVFFRRHASPVHYAVFGAVSSPAAAGIVWMVNRWTFGETVIGYLPLLAYIAVIAAIASGTVAFFSKRLATAESDADAPPSQRPSLMDRLPIERRGRLYHLSVQDHYVEVVTSNGTQLLLMRLSDAIGETGDVEGLQIHRSHWVAREAVKQVLRKGERVSLLLVNGTELPVSRARLKDVREAGLA